LSSKSQKQKLHSTIDTSSIAQTKSFHLLLFEKMQKKKKKEKDATDRQTLDFVDRFTRDHTPGNDNKKRPSEV
jgi:hypothetical protein